jgi:aspartyl-tRNA synthetase
LMDNAPSPVKPEQLKELHIKIVWRRNPSEAV